MQVPLLRQGEGIGALVVSRATAGPFHEKDIALLQSFADQAVIAIENVRLFNETKEALEQQTATAEILRVISGSVTDTQPVFDAIVQSAVRLFNAGRVRLFLVEGDLLRMRARHGPGTFDEDDNNVVSLPLHGSAVGQAVLQCEAIQFPDFEAPGVPAAVVEAQPRIRHPLDQHRAADPGRQGDRRDHRAARPTRGAVRQADGAAQTFADQAVIAIENVRLFNETKGGARAADGDGGDPQGDRQFAFGRAAGVRCDCRQRDAPVWGAFGTSLE